MITTKIHEQTVFLSKFIYLRRTQFRLTQKDLATKVNCSTLTINELENCNRNPTWAMAINILNALDTSLSEFAAWERGNNEGS